MGFFIVSPLFTSGQAIPVRFTRDGDNVSPPLEWHGAPPGTRSFALVLDDGVTGDVHWAAWDILAANLPEDAGRESGPLKQAVNSFGLARYDGPAPPPDETYHPYRFLLAALPVQTLGLDHGASVDAVREAIAMHRLEEAELVAIYTRIDPTAQIPG